MPAKGASGGIYVGWNVNHVEMEVTAITDQFIWLVVFTKRTEPWLQTMFYASHLYNVRNKIWEDFEKTEILDIVWMACGDFNCITNSTEKKGKGSFSLNPSITKFNQFLNSQWPDRSWL